MALPPSVQSGQSNSPQYSQRTFFAEQGYNVEGFQTGDILGSPSKLIDERIGGRNRTPNYTFPTDLPKYHFTLIENDWVENRSEWLKSQTTLAQGVINNLTSRNPLVTRQLYIQAMYKLPLPLGLSDEHEVKYEPGFNFLGRLEALRARASGVGSASVGLTLNTIKAVTLDLPEFRTYQLSWKFSPKNFPEAQEIQKIITALKIAMHPTPLLGKALLVFPRIFTMYFVPNLKYMYKFKPAVISAIKVDYQGGQPVPSFYKADNNIPSESPPESVTLTLGFLELEYWLDSDFKTLGDLPTNNPFDAFNYYTYDATNTVPDDTFLNRRNEPPPERVDRRPLPLGRNNG